MQPVRYSSPVNPVRNCPFFWHYIIRYWLSNARDNSIVPLSAAKGLIHFEKARFFAEFILERSEGLRMTSVMYHHFVRGY